MGTTAIDPEKAAASKPPGNWLRRGRVHFEHFLERILPHPDWLNWLDGDPLLASYLLDIVEHSPYFAEQLIRYPELLAELRPFGLPVVCAGGVGDAAGFVAALRMGYAGVRRSLTSMGTVCGTVIIRSVDQAVHTHEAMILRGYRRDIPFGPMPPVTAGACCVTALAVAALLLLYATMGRAA